MGTDNKWEQFTKTGSVEDYLEYKEHENNR